MIVAHVMGIPVEETVLPFVGIGASVVTVIVIALRTRVAALRGTIARRLLKAGEVNLSASKVT
jgi:hypothetical protein